MPPPPAPAELVSAITTLKDEFQHVADLHPWVCLAVPRGESQFILVGEAVHLYAETYPGIYGVATPRDPACRVVADHVEQLTARADRLLIRVLEHAEIPDDLRDDVRGWERLLHHGGGWVRWLWFATRIQSVWRVQHYAQVAATALLVLRDRCRAEGPAAGHLDTARQQEKEPIFEVQATGRPSIRKSGAVWELQFEGEKGSYPADGYSALCVVAKLVARPGQPFELKDLVDANERALLEGAVSRDEVLDDQAVDELQRKYRELEEDKEVYSDKPVELERIEADQKVIMAQLKNARRPDGRGKKLGETQAGKAWDKLRKSLTHDRLWRRLTRMPKLAAHLESAIKCMFPHVTYDPPSGSPKWETDGSPA
jgi:hypothetical protein